MSENGWAKREAERHHAEGPDGARHHCDLDGLEAKLRAAEERAERAEAQRDGARDCDAASQRALIEVTRDRDALRARCEALTTALNEYADHAQDSGWHNLAGEIRRRAKEGAGK